MDNNLPLKGKRVVFVTLGCKLNFAETSTIGKELVKLGCVRATRAERADICLVNTCSVTEAANRKGRQAINKLRKLHPEALILVTGCYAQLKPDEVMQVPGVDMVLGMNYKFDVPDLLTRLEGKLSHPQKIVAEDIRKVLDFHGACSADDRTRHFLKVQDGCDYFCTYCTIPLARGRSRNGKIEDVVRQAQTAIQEGAKEIVLTGVNIGDFGKTTGETFFQLVQALDAIDAPVRYRISSIEPNLLTDEMIEYITTSKHFTPHFHIPLQSGSDAMLDIMRRRYHTDLFASKVRQIKHHMPHAFIGVDVIVGARGETDEYFAQCQSFLESLNITQLHVFTYSEREGTRMLQIPYVVHDKEKKRRSEQLHLLSANKLEAFYQSQIGNTATVLWESKSVQGKMYGFTENYVRVMTDYDASKVNQFENIQISSENIAPNPSAES